jgi:hypothetical protein
MNQIRKIFPYDASKITTDKLPPADAGHAEWAARASQWADNVFFDGMFMHTVDMNEIFGFLPMKPQWHNKK